MDFVTQTHHCRPESDAHITLRMTGQSKMLSKAGKEFRYQFQRYGFRRMCHNRKQNVAVEFLQAELVAHTVSWPASKASFILDG